MFQPLSKQLCELLMVVYLCLNQFSRLYVVLVYVAPFLVEVLPYDIEFCCNGSNKGNCVLIYKKNISKIRNNFSY